MTELSRGRSYTTAKTWSASCFG